MFSLPAKGQKFRKVFTVMMPVIRMIPVIMFFFQLAMVSPMILHNITETKRTNSKTHQDSICNVKSNESLRHGLQIHIL
jgi:hypothetical protein